MVKGGGQNLQPDVTQVIDQLERHCLAPDGSLVSKSAYYDLQLVPSIPAFFIASYNFSSISVFLPRKYP